MDYLTNFSLKYAEIEDEANVGDSYSDNFIESSNVDNENPFATVSSPRQSTLDSLSTPSRNGYSVESEYSHHTSSSVSPSDIPDSPSEMMPKPFRRSEMKQLTPPSRLECENSKGDASPIEDDEHENNLLECCLKLGIHAILHPENNNRLHLGDSSLLSEDDKHTLSSFHLFILFTFLFSIKSNVFLYFSNAFKLTTWTALVSLAFAGSIGMTLIILACALPQYQLWWPFFVVLFYIFSIFPTLLAKRSMNNSLSGSSPCLELAIFLTMGFVISSFALPIVLARADVIMWGACYLTICGNFVVYGTIVGYFLLFDSEDNVYGGMA